MADAQTTHEPEVNAIARHIADGTTVDEREFYFDDDVNPLQKAYLDVAAMRNALLFLEEASQCVDELDNFGKAGFRHVVRLVSDRLYSVAGEIDVANSQICKALGSREVRHV